MYNNNFSTWKIIPKGREGCTCIYMVSGGTEGLRSPVEKCGGLGEFINLLYLITFLSSPFCLLIVQPRICSKQNKTKQIYKPHLQKNYFSFVSRWSQRTDIRPFWCSCIAPGEICGWVRVRLRCLVLHLSSPITTMCDSSAGLSLQCRHLNQMLGISSRHELSGVVLPCLLFMVKTLRECSYNDPRGSGKWLLFRYFVDFSECLPVGKFLPNRNLWSWLY